MAYNQRGDLMTVHTNSFPWYREMRVLLRMCIAAWVLAPLCYADEALTVADLLNGRRALQCFHNGTNVVYCKDLLSGETREVFTRAEETWEKWCGTINRDGTKLTCNDGSVPIVINLDGSNKEAIAPVGTNCHFRRDESSEDWVVYTGENESKNRAGTTWKVRIDKTTNEPVESTRTKIADIQFSCGFNGSGVYLGESYGTSIIMNVETGEQSPDFNDTRNCVGTMHPGDKPWIMFEESPAHDMVGIFAWNESDNSARRIWRLEKDSIFGNWSPNNENFGVILKNRHRAEYNGALFLVGISVDTSGDGDNDGSSRIAPMEISGMVGGPWVEQGMVNCDNVFRHRGHVLPNRPNSLTLVHGSKTVRDKTLSVFGLSGRLISNRGSGFCNPEAYYLVVPRR